MNGIRQTLGTAHWDLNDHSGRAPALAPFGAVGAVPAGRSVVEGGEIPVPTRGLSQEKENAANWLKLDPEVKCYLPGVPRAMYLPFPFQIVQSPNLVLMSFDMCAARPINMGKAEPYPDVDGILVGRWEGDTLVIQSDGFGDQTGSIGPGITTARNSRSWSALPP